MKDPLRLEVGSYNSGTAQETEDEILAQMVKPTRNRLRLEFIKKRKDFDQPVKFTETDSDKNVQFISFKDDQLGLREKKVMEIGYIKLYLDCRGLIPTQKPALKPFSSARSTSVSR